MLTPKKSFEGSEEERVPSLREVGLREQLLVEASASLMSTWNKTDYLPPRGKCWGKTKQTPLP